MSKLSKLEKWFMTGLLIAMMLIIFASSEPWMATLLLLPLALIWKSDEI